MGRGWGEEAAVGRASKHLATQLGIFRNSCQVRNMCYLGRLVILHHLYVWEPQHRGAGDHRGTAAEEHKI